MPDRLAALDLDVPAAGRALGAHRARHPQGPALPPLSRRPGGVRGTRARRERRGAGPARDAAAAARRAGAADRGRDRVRALVRGGAPSASGAGRTRIANWSASTSTRSSRWWPRASSPGAGGAEPWCTATGSTGASGAGGRPVSPPSLRAAPSPTTPTTGWCWIPRRSSSAPSTRTSPSRAPPGDIFQLGNTSWRILAVNSGTVRVADAHGQPPTIPVLAGRGARTERGAVERGGPAARGRGGAPGRRRRGCGGEVARGARAVVRCGAPDPALSARGEAHPGLASHPGDPRPGALLRRSGRACS